MGAIFKKLAKSVRQYKRDAILSPIFISLEVVFDVLIPYVMTFMLEEGVKTGNVSKILLYGGALIAMSLVALVFGALSGKFCSRASCGFGSNLRQDMFYAVQDFSFANIDKFSSASLITRMTTDVTFVQNAFMMIIRVAIRSPLMLIFGVTMTIIVGGPIAGIFAIVVPVMLLALFLIFRFASKYFKTLFKKYDKLNNIVKENIRGIRVVKSNNQEAYEIEKFEESSKDIYQQFTKAERIVVLSGPVMQLCMYACITIIAWLSAQTIIDSVGANLTTSELTTLITYTTQILMSLMMFSMVVVQITIAKASAERICEVLDEKPDITNKENAVNEVIDGSIVFENVNFAYKKDAKEYCLKDVNLTIKSGETIGIIGSTGSSKTTLVQLLPRLYDVTTGSLKIGGVDVRDYDIEVLRKNVAFVLQKNVLFSGTIRDNLKWGNPNATDEEMLRAVEIACVEDFVQKSGGLDRWVEQGGSNLSGGQRQRMCIARAILTSPKILVLDDSTSAVDMKTDAMIRKAFREEIPQITKIIIAQRIASVMDADKIIVMEGGRVNGFGSHDELMQTNEIYREVYNSQNSEGGDFDGQ